MTIAGLWSMLRQRGFIRDVHGTEARELLRGKRIAVDVAFWAVQGDMVESTTKRCQHFLLTSFWRLCRYLRVGALPLAVLDAPSGPNSKRRRRRPDGEFHHNIHLVKELFCTLGCPRSASEIDRRSRTSGSCPLPAGNLWDGRRACSGACWRGRCRRP